MSTHPDLFDPPPAFGTPVHKRHYRHAPDTSVAAARLVDTVTDEERVYWLIAGQSDGLTIKEAAALMGKTPNQISGRFTALQEKQLIEDSGERRGRSRVMKVRRP